MRGTIITFYSYKGGTGRSMAVANTAWILASNGLRVLTVDWDLEAPGLHRYFHPFLPDGDLKVSRGIVDLVWEFAAAAVDPETPDEPDWHEKFAEISPYAMSLEYDFPGRGTVDFVPAGRQDATYSALVSSFDWENFYERLGGGGFLEALKRNMRDRYDYVLIDSRTGLSDIAGICTVQLPDILVNCFSLSTQAIDGAAAVAASVGRQRRDGQVRIFPVPMRVEDGEQDKLDAGRDYARSKFGRFLAHVSDPELYWGKVEVPYKSFYAYEEILATIGDRPRQENTVLSATERIVGYLTDQRVTALEAEPPESERRELLALFQRSRDAAVPGSTGQVGGAAPRVFISYAYESAEHFEAVRELWFQLRSRGVDARMDLPPNQRPPDWSTWLTDELSRADLTLVVASPIYRRFVENVINDHRASGPEAVLIRDYYRSGRSTRRMLPIMLPGGSAHDIPDFLAAATPVMMEDLTGSSVDSLLREVLWRTQLHDPSGPSTPPSPDPTRSDSPAPLSPRLATLLRTLADGERRRAVQALGDVELFPVRWSSVSPGLALRHGAGRPPSQGQQLRGSVDDLAEMYRDLPNRRLVILGAPGSGKSTVVQRLILDLLATWDDGPVPMLVSAASWQPEVESFRSWILRQLREHPASNGSFAQDYLADLFDGGWIVAAVDGLDELSDLSRREIFRVLASGETDLPVVMTCRTQAYREMVVVTGRPLPNAAVLELEAININDAIEYLSESSPYPHRWSQVFRYVRGHPDSPLAQTLTTPAMLQMAGTVYSRQDTDPTELTDAQRFTYPPDFGSYLLRSYCATAYKEVPNQGNFRRESGWESARPWLRFLAHRMHERDTHDLAWWQLHTSAVARIRAFLLGLVGGVLGTFAFETFPVGSTGQLSQELVKALLFATLSIGALSAVTVKPPALPNQLPERRVVVEAISSRRRVAEAVSDTPRGLFWFRRRIDLTRFPSPRSALRADRTAATISGLVWAMPLLIALIVAMSLTRFTLTQLAGFGSLLVAGVMVIRFSTSAWGWYTLARSWLALRGRLPWRLMSFLDDAHRRGVLRQSGAVYQFRHTGTQDWFADHR